MRNIKLMIQYDGTNFFGWQRQREEPTVQQVIEDAIADLTQEKITLYGAGRTDTGVHARAQVANFHTESAHTPAIFQTALNARFGDDLAVIAAEEVALDWHARKNARGKVYEYVICNAPLRPVFDRQYMLHVSAPLDVDAMTNAASILVGEHDFRSFTRKAHTKENCVRTVTRLAIARNDPRVTVTVKGTGFLYMMVRAIAGALLEAGTGRLTRDDLQRILDARNRSEAGPTAPAHGLTLVRVIY